MVERIEPQDAADALATVDRAEQQVAREIGLPRIYWWGMAAGWLGLGVLGDLGPAWLLTTATVLFGAAHSTLASWLLDGRSRTSGVRVSSVVAGRWVPVVVVGMLLGFVALTIGLALLLDADHAGHPQIWTAAMVAAVIGFGGPEILAWLRRVFGA